jgi:hypothetical protein
MEKEVKLLEEVVETVVDEVEVGARTVFGLDELMDIETI